VFAQFGPLANPLQDFESHDTRQLQIQKRYAGQGIGSAVREFAGAFEVINGFPSIARDA
jgi:hypothetical protein